MRGNGLFKRIIRGNIIITATIIALIMILAGIILCENYKRSEIAAANDHLKNIGGVINGNIDRCIQKTEFIASNSYFTLNMVHQFDTTYNVMEFLTGFSSLMGAITGGESLNTNIIIYTENSTIFDSKYIKKMDALQGGDKIKQRFLSDNTIFVWDEEIYQDEYNENYFVLYRTVRLSKECIIKAPVYFSEQSLEISAMPHVRVSLERKGAQQTAVKETAAEVDVYQPLSNNYNVKASIPKSFLLLKYLQIFAGIILIFIFFLLIVIRVTKYTTNKITLSATDFINKLKENNYSIDNPNVLNNISEFDEILIIKNKIQQLMIAVKEISDAKYKSELEKKSFQLELLNVKINPHLLYNSLSAVKLLAFKSDNLEIADIIDKMVCYYRAVLNEGSELIPLSRELEMTKNYIKLNEISHNQTYHFVADIPPELLSKNVLHLMLQPFVENSIKHGFATVIDYPLIKITGETNGGYIYITITDNGCGIDESVLLNLNADKIQVTGYGIKNTYNRINLYYENDCSILFESEKNNFTSVTIKIKDIT